MRHKKALVAALATTIGLIGLSSSNAAEKVRLEEVVTGLTAPLAMVQPDGDERKFVIEQDGRIKIIMPDGQLSATPFLDLRSKIVVQWADFDERGVLGLAFHPQFKTNGRFYVAYSTTINFKGVLDKQFWWDHTNVVAEYKVSATDPNKADDRSERIISSIDWPQFNHNGHWIGFGPDGFLYVSTGDGGYANDWGIGHNVLQGNGQDLASPLGKILRLDVDKGGPAAGNPFANDFSAAPEVWAYGLRNPWRCSFDMGGTRQLFCGDVQQNSFEEVNIVEAGKNYGWRVMEATKCFNYAEPNKHPASCNNANMVPPILEYNNCTAVKENCKGISVTGGYVYRGSHKPWDGKYIFGDWSKSFAARDGQLFIATKGADGKWTMDNMEVTNMEGKLPYVLAFAQDAKGEVYALTSVTTGPVGGLDSIYRIVSADQQRADTAPAAAKK
jgi:glucose/arabinose dehydrogenase